MVWPVDVVQGISQDVHCLASILLRGNGGKSHKERLDFFYAPQAHACEYQTRILTSFQLAYMNFIAKVCLDPSIAGRRIECYGEKVFCRVFHVEG